jgi:Iap family predicted aminopeptidase
MIIQPINGYFNKHDTIDIISKIITIKIQYHEEKMKLSKSQKFIEVSELRILQLQKDLYNFKKYIEIYDRVIYMQSTIVLSELDSVTTNKKIIL